MHLRLLMNARFEFYPAKAGVEGTASCPDI